MGLPLDDKSIGKKNTSSGNFCLVPIVFTDA